MFPGYPEQVTPERGEPAVRDQRRPFRVRFVGERSQKRSAQPAGSRVQGTLAQAPKPAQTLRFRTSVGKLRSEQKRKRKWQQHRRRARVNGQRVVLRHDQRDSSFKNNLLQQSGKSVQQLRIFNLKTINFKVNLLKTFLKNLLTGL